MFQLDKHGISCPQRNRGFSIIELMVALVITLILLGGIGQIFLSSKKSFTIQNTLGRQQENGRYTIDTIAQDVRRAGYWGGNAQIDEIAGGTLDQLNDDGTCIADNTWGRMLNRRIYGLNNANAGYTCIPNNGATNGFERGDVLVLRYSAPWEAGCGVPDCLTTPTFEANRIYLRSSLFEGRIFLGSDANNPANEFDFDITTPPTGLERVAELVAHAYYIGDSGQTCEGIAVPSLFRATLNSNGAPQPEEIAYGVENLQIRYGVDTDNDESVNQYVDATGVADWDQVIAARIWVLTRAECPETGFTTSQTYTMGDVVYDPTGTDPAANGFRRQLYQMTIMLRNG